MNLNKKVDGEGEGNWIMERIVCLISSLKPTGGEAEAEGLFYFRLHGV